MDEGGNEETGLAEFEEEAGVSRDRDEGGSWGFGFLLPCALTSVRRPWTCVAREDSWDAIVC
jgi:hypothetical protein